MLQQHDTQVNDNLIPLHTSTMSLIFSVVKSTIYYNIPDSLH